MSYYIIHYGCTYNLRTGPPCDDFPTPRTANSNYSSPSVHLHTYTILFYSPEGDRPGPLTLQVNESRTSQGVPPRAIPVNNRVRSPPLLVHPGRDSLSLLACTQFFVFVHFRFVDREGRQQESFGLFYLCPRNSPHLSPRGSLPVHHAADLYRIFGICATLYLYARYLGLYEIISAARFSGFADCFSRMSIQPFIFRLILELPILLMVE